MYGADERCKCVVLGRTCTARTRGLRVLGICCFVVPALACASPGSEEGCSTRKWWQIVGSRHLYIHRRARVVVLEYDFVVFEQQQKYVTENANIVFGTPR